MGLLDFWKDLFGYKEKKKPRKRRAKKTIKKKKANKIPVRKTKKKVANKKNPKRLKKKPIKTSSKKKADKSTNPKKPSKNTKQKVKKKTKRRNIKASRSAGGNSTKSAKGRQASLKKAKTKLKKPSKKAKKIKRAAKVSKEIGIITHFFGKISVGIIKLKSELRVGDKIQIKGQSTDFSQVVNSIQHNHKDISSAKKGLEVGIKIIQPVHEKDKVFKG